MDNIQQHPRSRNQFIEKHESREASLDKDSSAMRNDKNSQRGTAQQYQQVQRDRNQSMEKHESRESSHDKSKDGSAMRRYNEDLNNSYATMAKKKLSNKGGHMFSKPETK